MKETRKGFLESLGLGPKNTEAVLKAAEEATKELDKAGIVRKEGDAVTELAQNIQAALAAAGVALPENALEVITAPIQAAVAQPVAEMPATPPHAQEEEEEQVTKEAPEKKPEPSEEYSVLKALATNQSQYIESTTKDMGEMAGAMVALAQFVKDLTPIAETVKGLDARMNSIETTLKETPRRASQAVETIVQNAEVERKIKEGAEPTKTILGIPVKD